MGKTLKDRPDFKKKKKGKKGKGAIWGDTKRVDLLRRDDGY